MTHYSTKIHIKYPYCFISISSYIYNKAVSGKESFLLSRVFSRCRVSALIYSSLIDVWTLCVDICIDIIGHGRAPVVMSCNVKTKSLGTRLAPVHCRNGPVSTVEIPGLWPQSDFSHQYYSIREVQVRISLINNIKHICLLNWPLMVTAALVKFDFNIATALECIGKDIFMRSKMEFSMQQRDALLKGTFHLSPHENNITMITKLRSLLYGL